MFTQTCISIYIYYILSTLFRFLAQGLMRRLVGMPADEWAPLLHSTDKAVYIHISIYVHLCVYKYAYAYIYNPDPSFVFLRRGLCAGWLACRLISGSRCSSQRTRLYIYICVLMFTQTCICMYTIPTPLSFSCAGAYAPAGWHAG